MKPGINAANAILFLVICITCTACAESQSGIFLERGPEGGSLVVTSLAKESVFDRAGLCEGDEIREIDFKPVAEISFAEAVMALSAAEMPGSSVIISVSGKAGYRIIRVSAPSPDPLQDAFIIAEGDILEAWSISRHGWERLISAACEYALGRMGSQDLFRAFRSSRSSFMDSRNRIIAVKIPAILPPGVRSEISLAKSRLADANTLRYVASRILYSSLISGEKITSRDLEKEPAEYLAAWLLQDIKSRMISETGIPGIERAWGYLRTNFLQARAPEPDPGEEREPVPERLAREAKMALVEAKDRLERISDLGVLVDEALSYAVASEYGAATLLGRMLLRFSAFEKRAGIAAGEGFGHLLIARAGMKDCRHFPSESGFQRKK